MINWRQITPFDFCGQLQSVLCQPVVYFDPGPRVQTSAEYLRNPTTVPIRNSPGFSVTP